jgi:hypothetical protein
MKLVWKLLRQHISLPQFTGFFFANLFGMLVVLLGVQFYRDVIPVFTQGDSFIKEDYLVVSKHISTSGTLSGNTNTFGKEEEDMIAHQPFCKKIGEFISSQYKVSASMGVEGAAPLTTEMFFEAVPDGFVGTSSAEWKYEPGSKEIPIILPRSYLTIYNFGFAQSHSLPKISEGLVGMISMRVFIHGNGHDDEFKGRVIGFSGRLNTILVPKSFMDWSNQYYTPGQQTDPSRLIMEVFNPTDDHIAKFMQSKGYEVEDDKLDAGKTTYFLKIVTTLVMSIGLIISVLSFYILMLSIYLLVEKNTSKLENLLLIGYSPQRVSLPYQLLTLGLNALVLVLALGLLVLVRGKYMDMIILLFPQMPDGSLLPALLVGGCLFVLVSVLNIVVIRRKVASIWLRKG